VKSPTVFDVAERAGVSKSTVSLVNQDSPLVSPDTRLKVETAAKELGYVYNRAAATLRKPKSATIGLVIPNLRNNFFAEAVIGVEEFFRAGSSAGNKTLFLSHHLESPEKLTDAVRSMLESRVDGLIIVPALNLASKNNLQMLVQGTPTVFLSRKPSFKATYVGPDNFVAGKAAAQHLIEHGYKELMLMGGNSGSSAFDERMEGVLAAINENPNKKIKFSALQFTPSRSEGFTHTQNFIKTNQALPAVIAYNDLVATGVISAASSSGLTAGKDYAVVGVDDIEEAKFLTPPLTTINTKPVQIGRQAAIELERLIESGNKGKPMTVIVPNELVVRGTCGCSEVSSK